MSALWRFAALARRRALWLLPAVLVATPVLAAAFPAVLRVPRREPAAGGSLPRALFSHGTHASFGCYACHPSTFPQAPLAFTHREMNEGRFCGRCHDGRIAIAVSAKPCQDCHVSP